MFAIIDRYSDEHFHFIELLVHGDMTVYRKTQQHEDASWQVQGQNGIWVDEPLFNDIVTDAYDPATVEPDGAPIEPIDPPLENDDDVIEMPVWLPNSPSSDGPFPYSTPLSQRVHQTMFERSTRQTWSSQH